MSSDNWRDVATDPPPTERAILVCNPGDAYSRVARLRSLEYFKNPEKAHPWVDGYGRLCPAPQLWQPFPEPRP